MSRKIVISLFFLVSIFSILILAIFFAFVFYKGFSSFSLEIIFDNVPVLDAILGKQRVFDGIFNAIVGSLFVSLLAIVFALPLGFLSGVFIAIFASKKVLSVHVCDTIRRGHLVKCILPIIKRDSINAVATVKSLVACSTQSEIVRTLMAGLKLPTSQSEEIKIEINFS